MVRHRHSEFFPDQVIQLKSDEINECVCFERPLILHNSHNARCRHGSDSRGPLQFGAPRPDTSPPGDFQL